MFPSLEGNYKWLLTRYTKVCLVKAMVFLVVMYECEELDYKES